MWRAMLRWLYWGKQKRRGGGPLHTLADVELIRGVCDGLGSRATLHIVESGDHSFNVLKRSGRTPDQVMDELADAVRDWAVEIAP